jgi:hypothetical protein
MTELTLICETCHFPVARGKGSVYVRTGDLRDHRTAKHDWREAHPDGEAVDLADLVDNYPEDIHWRTAHDACRDDHDEGCYEIDDEHISTWGGLAHWTAHLMEKTWLQDSDWDDLLREVAGEIPSRRIRVAAREAA